MPAVPPRFVIVAGGTGGHFYPGLAVARALKARGAEVQFIVRRKDVVRPLLEREGFSHREIRGAGLDRRSALRSFGALVIVALSVGVQWWRFVRCRPRAVIAMGGYLSAAPVIAARLLGIRVLLHEQNVRPGVANRLLARLAQVVAVSFPGSERVFPSGKTVVTGNPVRQELAALPPRDAARRAFGLDPERTTLLVFGGSLGARRLNALVEESLPALTRFAGELQWIHVTGESTPDGLAAAYRKAGFRAVVLPYCHDMPHAYAAADLVLCRAGATTVAELVAVRRPAILVPYPYAAEGHQEDNARFLTEAGAGILRLQATLENGGLAAVLTETLADPEALDRLRRGFAAATLDPFSAAERIVDVVMSETT